ncbi:MAG: hypothetical protein JNL18_10210 [Planctomycetaceae bacterium]|nr:hypothetical protein [Lacipirellula limnantheis]MBL9163097.1 hypothetical protein [Planctomycetaceae bacterium]
MSRRTLASAPAAWLSAFPIAAAISLRGSTTSDSSFCQFLIRASSGALGS